MRQLRTLRNALSLDRARRAAACHTMLGRVAKSLGTRVYDLHVTWHEDPEFAAVWRDTRWEPRDVDARKYTLHSLLKTIRDVPGDTAECGAYHGMASWLILHATRGQARTHHVFDSFQGLSAPTTADAVDRPRVFRWRKHDLAAAQEILRRNLEPFESWQVHPGWIPERFGDVADRTFAFVHVDVDLHEPTRDSFEFFWPRLAPGGAIVCDDDGFASCPGARRAVDEFAARHGVPVLRLPTGQAIVRRERTGGPG